jgi:uncharacterized lipoprotein YmbA
MIDRHVFFLLVLLGLLCGLTACSTSPKVNFYTLSAIAKATDVKPVSPLGGGVAIGPVTLPEIVDRAQLVVQLKDSQVDILEFHRWAEPLKSQIPRLVADDVGRLLGSYRVTAYPQIAGSDADVTVPVDIQRFSTEGDNVVIDAFWTLRRSSGEVARSGRSTVREAVAGKGYDAVVEAYSRALFSISSDIADALRGEMSKTK